MAPHEHHSWRIVSYLEFDKFLRQYPRKLIVDPPLDRPARFRAWSDPALGDWPENVVAKSWHVHRSISYQVRGSL